MTHARRHHEIQKDDKRRNSPPPDGDTDGDTTSPSLFPYGPIAADLQACREAAGLTQDELAAKAKLSVQTVQAVERGLSADPKSSTLVNLSRALGVTVGQLAGVEVLRK